MNTPDDAPPEVWVLAVDADGVMELPPDLLSRMGWTSGDALEFLQSEDGVVTLRKVEGPG
jgi:hypothetical protein